MIGSENDHMMRTRDRLRADPALRRRYDEAKLAGAAGGRCAYWQAKNAMLDHVLGEEDG